MPPQPLPSWLEHALIWLNYPVYHHWLLAACGFGVVILYALYPSSPRPEASRCVPGANAWGFAAALVICLILFRWPTWFYQNELNPDESQMTAGAITLRSFPLFWKYVDGATHGPINVYALTFASFLGLPLNFFGVRLFAALLEAGALIATWRTLRQITSERTARLGVLPALAFWCLVSHHDFIHYSSELMPVFLMAAAGWLAAEPVLTLTPLCKTRLVRLLLAGVALGAVPLAKPQGAPVALALAALLIIVCLAYRRKQGGIQAILMLITGGLGFPVAVTLVVLMLGLGPDAWNSYVLSNILYVSSQADVRSNPVSLLLALAKIEPLFGALFLGSVAFAAATILTTWRHAAWIARGLMAASLIFVTASLVVILVPGRPLTHYLQLLVVPLAWLTTAALRLTEPKSAPEKFHSNRGYMAATVALLAWGLAWPLLLLAEMHSPYAGQFTHHRFEHPPSQAAYFIRQRAQAGDTMAMWGWRPQLYVETQLPQGTRESCTERQITPAPMQQFYRDRYLKDMIEREPTWFVDSIGPASFAFTNREIHGHERFEALAQRVSEQYELLAEIEHLRIYRLKGRPAQAQGAGKG
jgi:hypothetical protein